METRVQTARVPPLGWTYQQEGFEQPIVGSNYENLIANLTQFRVDNRLTLGNPDREVEQQICDRYPAQCNPPRSNDSSKQPAFTPKTLHDRVAQWAANRYEQAGSITYVSQDEAERRAAICAQCPQNELNYLNSCPPCISDLQRTLLLISQRNITSQKSKLGACKVAGHHNDTASFLPERLLRHRINYKNELPSFCWMNDLAAQ